MYSVTCYDPRPEDNFTDEREIALQRVRWLDEYVGGRKWYQTFSWNRRTGSWIHHYELDCSASIAALFKLTFG